MNTQPKHGRKPGWLLLVIGMLWVGHGRAQDYVWDSLAGPGMRINPVCAMHRSTDFIIAWVDFRNSEETDIRGCRVDPYNGQLLDSTGIRVSCAPRNQEDPAAVAQYAGPTYFMIVWTDWRFGSPAIYGTRIGPNGAVLDPTGIPIRVGPNAVGHAAVAAGDTHLLVVWEETPPDYGSHIAAARVSAGGSVLDTTPLRISRGLGRQSHPSAVFSPLGPTRKYAIVWEQHSPADDSILVFGARVTEQGLLLDTGGVRVCRAASVQTRPSIARSANENWPPYFVVWLDRRNTPDALVSTWLDSSLGSLQDSGMVIDSTSDLKCDASVRLSLMIWCDWSMQITWSSQPADSDNFRVLMKFARPGEVLSPWSPISLGPGTDLLRPAVAPAATVAFPGPLAMMGIRPQVPPVLLAVYPQLGVSVPSSRSMGHDGSPIRITPSVTRECCWVEWSSACDRPMRIDVLDATGRLRKTVRSNALSSARRGIRLSVVDLPEGVYLVRLRDIGESLRLVILK